MANVQNETEWIEKSWKIDKYYGEAKKGWNQENRKEWKPEAMPSSAKQTSSYTYQHMYRQIFEILC